MEIPLSIAGITDAERDAVMDVLNEGELKGAGRYWRRVNQLIEREFGAQTAMMTTSCTHALEMAAMLLNVGPGDEVVVPSYTFPSTATAFARCGADIEFCEVRPDTLNIDTDHLRKVVTDDTDVVVVVHYGGVACEMDDVNTIAATHDAAVVEDAAQGVDAAYGGEALGTIGDIGCYSFHETKTYSAGEGGALVLNDDRFVERAEYVLHKGTNYAKFRRGEVDRYTWVDHGSSYVPSEIQAALALAQLRRRDEIRTAQRRVHEAYHDGLSNLAAAGNLRLPVVPDGRRTNYHTYHALTDDGDTRDALVEALRDEGVGAASHYEPLHSAQMGTRYGYEAEDLPRTEDLAGRLIRLPVHERVDEGSWARVINAIRSFFQH